MKKSFQPFAPLLLMAVLIATAVITGCGARVSTGYRSYDNRYNDYHTWDNNEVVFYGQWENENHRHHTDYRRLRPADQQAYWAWRHDHH